jgi:hypothetical protein
MHCQREFEERKRKHPKPSGRELEEYLRVKRMMNNKPCSAGTRLKMPETKVEDGALVLPSTLKKMRQPYRFLVVYSG